mmetsp:Transcript_34188/g.108479  ORF Transcript_34188/g.108479 Transcript_34188/m.108479 type:complete len:91 (+) Transcript_34188:167-439(+)
MLVHQSMPWLCDLPLLDARGEETTFASQLACQSIAPNDVCEVVEAKVRTIIEVLKQDHAPTGSLQRQESPSEATTEVTYTDQLRSRRWSC